MLAPAPLAPPSSLVLLLARLALLSGCGGDDGPQTKEGFILDADGVCENFVGEFADAGLAAARARRRRSPTPTRSSPTSTRSFGERLGDVRLPDAGAARTQAQAYVESVRRAEPLLERLRATADGFLEAAKGSDAQALSASPATTCAARSTRSAPRARSPTGSRSTYGLNLCGNLD